MDFDTIRFGSKWREVLNPQPLTLGDGDSINNDIILTENQQSLVLSIDAEQFTKLLSSAINGANIYFPDEYIEIIYPLIKAGKMALCDEIANCIETSEAVKNALSAYASQGGSGIAPDGVDTVVGSENDNLSDENLVASVACNDNAIAGACLAVIETMNGLAVDWIEAFQASALPYEIAGYVLTTNPIAGAANFSAGDLVDWLTDEVKTQYEGAYNTTLRNEAAKILYDIACQDCELTIDDVFSAFAQESSVSINPLTAWRNFILDIIQINVGAGLVYAFWGFMVATWKAGSVFDGLQGVSTITYAVAQSTPIDPSVIGASACNPDPCSLPIFENFESALGDCVTIISGNVVASPFGGMWLFESTGGSGLIDPSLQAEVTTPLDGLRTVDLDVTPNVTKAVAITLALYDSSSNFLGQNQIVPTLTGGVANPVSISHSASGVKYIRIVAANSGGGSKSLGIDNINYT